MRDLLNVDTSAVAQLPPDEVDGFDNNAHLQGAPDYLIEKWFNNRLLNECWFSGCMPRRFAPIKVSPLFFRRINSVGSKSLLILAMGFF